MAIHLEKQDKKWIVALLEQAVTRTKDKEKQNKLKKIATNVKELGNTSLKITINEGDIAHVYELLQELEDIAISYSNSSDITDINVYDGFKKQITSKLEYLSTLKDAFKNQTLYLEDYLKKVYRIEIINDLMENHVDPNKKKPSFTQAKELVDADDRYIEVKEQVTIISNISTQIKTKYDFHMQILSAIVQSISTASKERQAAKLNG